MPDIVISRMGVPIRLTEERWSHIADNHNELIALKAEVLEAVERPERILAGGTGELMAVQEREPGVWLVVVYRESTRDGFIITAFLTSKSAPLQRRRQVWP